jgi:hypothetical protein
MNFRSLSMKKQVDRRDLQKERHWLEIIQRQEHSGESVRAFCRREAVTESAFYWWRRELSRRHVKHSADQQHRGAARFLPVEVSDDGKGKGSGLLILPRVRLRAPRFSTITQVPAAPRFSTVVYRWQNLSGRVYRRTEPVHCLSLFEVCLNLSSIFPLYYSPPVFSRLGFQNHF